MWNARPTASRGSVISLWGVWGWDVICSAWTGCSRTKSAKEWLRISHLFFDFREHKVILFFCQGWREKHKLNECCRLGGSRPPCYLQFCKKYCWFSRFRQPKSISFCRRQLRHTKKFNENRKITYLAADGLDFAETLRFCTVRLLRSRGKP